MKGTGLYHVKRVSDNITSSLFLNTVHGMKVEI